MWSKRQRFVLRLALCRDEFSPPSGQTREQVMTRARMHANSGAYDTSRLIAILGCERAVIGEADAWQAMFHIARQVQLRHTSWSDFADAYVEELDVISDGRAQPNPRPWVAGESSEVPWDTELGDPRVLRTSCPSCGAAHGRPSVTAYIYCDYCAGLVDYDFVKACEVPIARPGPVYEALAAELGPAIAQALDDHDVDGMVELQRRLFAGYVDACPLAVPIRARDPAYRDAYVAYLAEGETLAAFDADARRLRAEMEAAARAIALPLDLAAYRALVDATFAHEARRDALAQTNGLYAKHPDGASRELLRRIGWSMFAQGWLPLLDDAERAALIARCGLRLEHAEVEPPPSVAAVCTSCGGEVRVFDGARRLVCDRCGDKLDVTDRVRCGGCDALLAAGDANASCPRCR